MIIIRADANELIGTGHVMRCLSIARAFRRNNEDVLFVTADEKSSDLIRQNGFKHHVLGTKWSDMESELPLMTGLIRRYEPSLLLIDGYYVTDFYFSELRKYSKTAYVDDINQQKWNVDYLINYNIYAMTMDYQWCEETQTKRILGPEYTPLREEFENCPAHLIRTVKDIFVSAGGSDPLCITEQIMSTICTVYKDIRFHFIVGALNPRLRKIKKQAAKTENAVLHINERHMADVMGKCDIAVSAAGTTLYELCAVGTPTITYVLADNQRAAAKEFEKQGIMLNAGDCRSNPGFIPGLKAQIETFIKDQEMRSAYSEKMQTIVDGKGSDRLAEELLK